MSVPRFVRVEVVEDRTASTGSGQGFLKVRRWVLVNAYEDGTRGPPYAYDVVERDALDAVAIAAWARRPSGVGVWLRRCLRPPLLSRGRVHVPMPWPENVTTLLEVPAGLVDSTERGWEGVREAAARELAEETGLWVPAVAVKALGNPFLLSPGVLGEMIFPVAVEVPSDAAAGVAHTTSADRTASRETPAHAEEVERGAEVAFFPLEEALEQVTDAKSEIVLRRLRESLR